MPPSPVPIPSQRPRESRQSSLSANDKGDNEVIPGAVHRSHGIYLTDEKNPGRPQLRDCRLTTSHPLKWGPNEAGRITPHVKKGEGRSEGNDVFQKVFSLTHFLIFLLPLIIILGILLNIAFFS